jgi:acetyltransferase
MSASAMRRIGVRLRRARPGADVSRHANIRVSPLERHSMQHYLRPLISPASVAMVGASEREGSVGRTAFANLLAGGFDGPIHAVNPRHATVQGRPAFRTLAAIERQVDLAVIATPPAAVPAVLADAPRIGLKAAVVMTAPPTRNAEAWSADVRAAAVAHGVHLVGAGAFGIIRTDIGLDATFCAPSARPGRLALVAQSGAVVTALLDFASPQSFGFSTVISLGTGLGVGFGQLLDCLVLDPVTDGILLFVEDAGEARPFISALRSAARTKPVIVLKAGRALEAPRVPSADAVFEAALRRAGAVRVCNYTELFAAARILATGRIPQGDRLAIVSNGRGPALLAADSVVERGVELAQLSPATVTALDRVLPYDSVRRNPVDLRGDAPATRMAEAVSLVLADPAVDAVVALHVSRPAMTAEAAARGVASVVRDARKPVLGAWLGALDRPEVQAALEEGHVVNFYTPENAVAAFSFLATYRRNQAWLLEAPPLQPEPEPLDLDAAERLRTRVAETGRTLLVRDEIDALLTAFGIATTPAATVQSPEALDAAVRALRFPVTLSAPHGDETWTRTVRTRGALQDAWREIAGEHAGATDHPRVRVDKPPRGHPTDVVIGVATDPAFGPVILLGAAGRVDGGRVALMLPPLNRRLAHDLVAEARTRIGLAGAHAPQRDAVDEALIRLLLRISTLVGAAPWVTELALGPITLHEGRAEVGEARARVDPSRRPQPGYRHMAIHPYPAELIEDVTLRDGTRVTVRPIRPEDAELEREFVDVLSPQSRYYRFFYQIHELTPMMIARFTQVDYDREMALVAVADIAHPHGHPSFLGVARYNANPDGSSAEFAIVIADAWQKRGLARLLMARLVAAARRRGFERLVGLVLRENAAMLALSKSLGFTVRDDPDDADQVVVTLDLA